MNPKFLTAMESFQSYYPLSCIGGSVGLYLQGIKIRDLNGTLNDLDVIIFDNEDSEHLKDELRPLDDPFDYDFQVLKVNKFGCHWDISFVDELLFKSVRFHNRVFKVNPVEIIIAYKVKYANNGSLKHLKDLEYIKKNYPHVKI